MKLKIMINIAFITLLGMIFNVTESARDSQSKVTFKNSQIGSFEEISPERTSQSGEDSVLQSTDVDYELFPELRKTYVKPREVKKFKSEQELAHLALQFARVIYNTMTQEEFVNYIFEVGNEDKLIHYLSFAHDVQRESNISEVDMNRYLDLLLYLNEYKTKFIHILEYDLSNLYNLLHPSEKVIARLANDLLESADLNNLTWNDIANVYKIQWRIPVDYYQLSPVQKNRILRAVNHYLQGLTLKKSTFKDKVRRNTN